DPVCGEKEYKIGTCRICGLQLAYYTGNTWQHRYVSRDIETYSLRNPGKNTTATLKVCELCGDAEYFCEYINYHYVHSEDGYTLTETSFQSYVTNGLYFRAGFPVGDEKTVIAEGGTAWGSSVIAYCIEKNVTRIETGAFRHDVCLQSVVLPSGLEYIGEDAFFNCPRLKTVYFRGTEEEWKKIDLTNNGAYLSGVKIVFNYGEGDTSFAKNLVTPERYYTLYSNLNKAYELTVFSPVSAVGKTAGVIAVTGFVKEGASASGIWADSVTGRIAFSVYDGAQVLKVYDSKTGSQVGRISPDYGSHYETAAGDGMFALLGGNRMVIYDAATLEKKKELTFAELSEGGTPECLAVARGMVFFVFRKNPNLIYCCDPETGSLSIVSGVSGLTEGDYYSPRFSVSADGGTLLLSLAQKAVTVDTGSLTATGIVDVKQTSNYVFFNGNGFTFVSFDTYNTTVNGAYKSTDRFPVYSYLEPGAGIVHKNAESMFKAAGYTPFDFLYSDGSVDVFTAYDKNGTFYTLFVRGGKVRAVRAVGRSLLPLGDGRFIIWNGSDCAIIVNAP
ncbi:MAG: leucine-rich repeat protein, partial [Clostridia bacterium]|nr:leucine-rich repeat protein [Clostridia bacterium]